MIIPGDDDSDGSGGILTEKSQYEPDEFDPDSLGPSGSTSSDVDFQSPVAGLFVKLVLVFNAALLALSLGPMLAYFRGQVVLGSRVFFVGVVLFAYGTYRYLKFTRLDDEDGETDEDGDATADEPVDDA